MRLPFSVVTAVWVVAFLTVIGNTLIASLNLGVLTRNEQVVNHTRDVRRELALLHSELKDAETGNRGFQVTGREEYLEPYLSARADIPVNLERLRTLLSDDPRQQPDLAELDGLIRDKLADLAGMIAARRADGPEKARALMLTGRGKAIMDQIRVVVARMDEHYEVLLAEREAESRAKHRATSVTNLLGGGVALGVAAAAFGFVRREFARRQVAVDALRESESLKTAVIASAMDGVVTIDADGRVLEFNPAAEAAFGYSRAEAVGRVMSELIVPPDLRAAHDRGMAHYLATGEGTVLNRRLELLGLRRDGTEFPVEVSITPIRTAGRPHFTGFLRDISDRKRAEDVQAERVRLAALRADVGTLLATGDAMQPVLQQCVEHLVRHTNVAFARVWTLNEDTQVLELRASAGLYTHLGGPHARVPVGEFKIGRIAASRLPHLTNDVPNDPNISDPAWARREGMVAFAGYPLGVEGRVVGVLAMFARRPLSDAILADLAPLADGIAQWIGRQRVVAALRSSEARFRLLTEAIPQVVWNADANGRVTYFNARWVDFTGVSVDAAQADGWMTAVHPDDRVRVSAAWRTTVESQSDQFIHEFRLLRPDGESYRWFLSVAVPVRRADGGVDQWIGSIADIDDQKREAERLEGMVRDRTVELKRSNEELEKFAYVASHDLQEPLRKIQAFGDRLEKRCRDEFGEQGKEYLDRILASAGRMRRLIDDLLSFSRVSTKRKPLVPVDLNDVFADVVADLEHRISPGDGRVDVGPLPTLRADPTQMRQLFQNLIGNAVKFQAPDVPPVVHVSAAVWDCLPPDADPPAPPGAGWRIVVRDNGIGFEQQFAGRIFEVFQRLHGRNEYEGTGIGLAICRKIVERHGGGITARSRPGQGTAFIIDLPADPDEVRE